MGRRPAAYQSHQARGLRRVTLLVPESCATGLRDLARVLRTQQQHRTAGPPLGCGGSARAPSLWSILVPARGVRSETRGGQERSVTTEP
jgi:hypothetical protein